MVLASYGFLFLTPRRLQTHQQASGKTWTQRSSWSNFCTLGMVGDFAVSLPRSSTYHLQASAKGYLLLMNMIWFCAICGRWTNLSRERALGTIVHLRDILDFACAMILEALPPVEPNRAEWANCFSECPGRILAGDEMHFFEN